jgi:peptidoglycan biosynthesis protein MviN/MurJ (putative lipid II flippase)
MNGWQRLWELVKCVVAIAAAIWCVMSYSTAMPWPNDTLADINRVSAMFLVAVIGGGIPYGALSALEWVCRGFRPKKTE